MREPENYWTRRGAPIPELKDLPLDSARLTDERKWESLSPGMRRAVWRDAIHREAKARGLSEDILFRLRAATIAGSLSSLDEYLLALEAQDARRSPMAEDVRRLQRADEIYAKSSAQSAARVTL